MKKILFIVFLLSFIINSYAQEESLFGSKCAVKGEDFYRSEHSYIWLYEKGSLTLENTSLKDAYAEVVKDLNDYMYLYHYNYLYKIYPEMPAESVSLEGDIDDDMSASYKCNIDIKNDNNKKVVINISAFGKTGFISLEQAGKNVQVVRKTAILDKHADAAKYDTENKPGDIINGWQTVNSYFDSIEFLCNGEKADKNEVMSASYYACDDCVREKYFKNMDIKETYNALFKDIPDTFESFPKTLPLNNKKIEAEWIEHEFAWHGNKLYVNESSKETEEYYTNVEFIQEKDGVKVLLSGYGVYPE